MNLFPSEMSPRRALWMGLLVSIAFRVFAYGALCVGLVLLSSYLSGRGRNAFGLLVAGAVILAALVVVPLVAGFFGGYYWRHLNPNDYTQSIFLADLVLLGGGLIVTGHFFTGVLGLILIGSFDVALCVIGGESGSNFWKGEVARQFVGDFSVRDEDD